ncbi:MAG TPA: TMEM175 family protein [Puia sp.]|jgi:uncharacterized membrane protein|nr:TMEM175 family protein [Puia sp.]
MIREKIFPMREEHDSQGYRVRGHEIQRIETFSDAVFAFAVTLLIVSLEVPKSFDELLVSMRGFFAFAICFTLLMLVWYEQHIFFRRYALDDTRTMVLNSMLIFIVLFYVYPLKFVFSLLFGEIFNGPGKNQFSIRDSQVSELFVIYGLGYFVIYLIFLLMYRHALRRRGHLQLSPLEVFDTRTKMYAQLTMVVIGACAVIFALTLPPKFAWLWGWWYFTIPPAIWMVHGRRGAIRRRIKS